LRGLTDWAPNVGAEPNLASLTGLLPANAPFGFRLALGATSVALASGLTVAVMRRFWHRVPVPVMCIGWLWGLWFLASPFAHFPDEIEITVPVLAYLGQDGSYLPQRGPVFSLYAIFFSLIFFPTSVAGVNFLSLVLLAVVIAMGVASRARCAPSSDAWQASQQ